MGRIFASEIWGLIFRRAYFSFGGRGLIIGILQLVLAKFSLRNCCFDIPRPLLITALLC